MRKPFTLAFALALGSMLGACGFHPLYGDIGEKPGAKAMLGAIYVDPIAGERIGYELRNSLINHLAGANRPDQARYRLKVTAQEGVEAIAVETNASITRYNYNLVAHYELSDMRTGKVIKAGAETTLAAYDVVQSPYATLVARQDAQKRGAEDVANLIGIKLAVYFRKNPK